MACLIPEYNYDIFISLVPNSVITVQMHRYTNSVQIIKSKPKVKKY